MKLTEEYKTIAWMYSSHNDVIKWKQSPLYWSLCGEFTGHRWIPLTKASDADLWCFLWSAWRNGSENNRDPGDLRRHHAHSDVTVRFKCSQNYIKLFIIINGLLHYCSISIALETLLSCIKPSKWVSTTWQEWYATSIVAVVSNLRLSKCSNNEGFR